LACLVFNLAFPDDAFTLWTEAVDTHSAAGHSEPILYERPAGWAILNLTIQNIWALLDQIDVNRNFVIAHCIT
jgi:hypothetical protein